METNKAMWGSVVRCSYTRERLGPGKRAARGNSIFRTKGIYDKVHMDCLSLRTTAPGRCFDSGWALDKGACAHLERQQTSGFPGSENGEEAGDSEEEHMFASVWSLKGASLEGCLSVGICPPRSPSQRLCLRSGLAALVRSPEAQDVCSEKPPEDFVIDVECRELVCLTKERALLSCVILAGQPPPPPKWRHWLWVKKWQFWSLVYWKSFACALSWIQEISMGWRASHHPLFLCAHTCTGRGQVQVVPWAQVPHCCLLGARVFTCRPHTVAAGARRLDLAAGVAWRLQVRKPL